MRWSLRSLLLHSLALALLGWASYLGFRPPLPAQPPGPGLRLRVNDARAEQLERLPGIGPRTATAIVESREREGPFVSAEELRQRVRGLGPWSLRRIEPYLSFAPPRRRPSSVPVSAPPAPHR